MHTEPAGLAHDLSAFDALGTPTRQDTRTVGGVELPVFVNEFWTSKQRAANRLHEVSYRACFKPQLPRFFLTRTTRPDDVVYDPFSGRGTTAVEAALAGRVPWACDANPVSRCLLEPRLRPPDPASVSARLAEIPLDEDVDTPEELLVFYHPETLRALCNLRDYLVGREADGSLDPVDAWIRMVALNRLTGHSPGFFSVYTLPPNQAASVASQERINARREQEPPRRDVVRLIEKKSRSLLSQLGPDQRAALASVADQARVLTGDCRATPELPDNSVSLVVTSPPFLDVVNYKQDNWLRCWFIGVDPDAVDILQFRNIEDWERAMTQTFVELGRLLKPDGRIAFEVGEVRGGSVKLEEHVVRCAADAGLGPELILINAQEFTKTANIWGVDNNQKGTNSNRIVVLRGRGTG